MSFTLNSMLFMNNSLDRLNRNLSDEDFKYLSTEFSAEKLELVKKEGVYPYKYFDSFKKLWGKQIA